MKISAELRPCMIKNTKALFHRWSDNIVQNGLREHVGTITMAIVEYDDGSIGTVYPTEIKFISSKVDDYCFDK